MGNLAANKFYYDQTFICIQLELFVYILEWSRVFSLTFH